MSGRRTVKVGDVLEGMNGAARLEVVAVGSKEATVRRIDTDETQTLPMSFLNHPTQGWRWRES